MCCVNLFSSIGRKKLNNSSSVTRYATILQNFLFRNNPHPLANISTWHCCQYAFVTLNTGLLCVVTVDAARWSQDSEGAWLALRVKSPQAAMAVCDAMKPGKEYTATLKGKGRSLDANAYAWVLLDKLAAHYGVAREKVYRQEIQSIGGVSEVLCLREKAAEAFCRSWERNGIGRFAPPKMCLMVLLQRIQCIKPTAQKTPSFIQHLKSPHF